VLSQNEISEKVEQFTWVYLISQVTSDKLSVLLVLVRKDFANS